MLISDHRIIRSLLIIFYTVILVTSCKHEHKYIDSEMKNETLSIFQEQDFWNNWISDQDEYSCPLEPFIISYTEEEISQVDNAIRQIDDYTNSLLIVRSNIDNGIFQIHYYSWNESEDFVNYVKWPGLNSEIAQGQQTRNANFLKKINRTLNRPVIIDLGNRNTLDGDSIYVSLLHDGLIRRFATYNPMVENYSSEFPINYLEYMRQYIEKKSL